MEKINLRIYIIISFIILALLILLVAYYSTKNNTGQNITPTPPSFEITPTLEPALETTPDIIEPTDFTGVRDEELPPDLQALSEQKQELKNQVPLSQPQFEIDFDYGEDKFAVSLREPKNQAQTTFEDWLQNNYPAIPLDRFIVN